MPIATVTSKGQITIPKEIREQLGLLPGTRVRFALNERGEYVMSRPHVSVKDLYGILSYDGPPVSVEQMDEAIREHFQ